MTSAQAPALSVHICTRDRPSSVGRLLGDLALVGAGRPAAVTVYDDSTTLPARQATRAVCADAGGPVRYFGEDERVGLLAEASAVLGPARDCLRTSRPLGTPGWDLAGVRFTAMLAAALDPHPDGRHLFLDDDMRLVTCAYAGHELVVDPAVVAAGLAGVGLGPGPFAAGAAFVGRADLSALEHFEAVVERVGRGEVVEVGGTGAAPLFPVVVTSDPYVHPDSPGISGGFLLTNGHALRSVPLLRSYNEDWIWLRQLRARGGAVHRFGFSVVHAGATHFGFSVRGLLTQFDGEVLDQALVLGSVDEALRGCRARLHAVVERAAAVSVVAAGYAPAAVAVGIQTLERVAVEVGRRSAAGYCATLDRHLERSDRWRDAFTADPTLCASSQSALSPLTGTGRLLWT